MHRFSLVKNSEEEGEDFRGVIHSVPVDLLQNLDAELPVAESKAQKNEARNISTFNQILKSKAKLLLLIPLCNLGWKHWPYP